MHVLDLTLWLMGNPKPVAVTGVARAEIAHQEGAFSIWGGAIPPEFDVEDFSAAFVRFENGATLILEVSWLLHHDTDGRRYANVALWHQGRLSLAQVRIYESNYATQQLYNRTLKITIDSLEPHALECVEFAQAVVDGAPSPVPAEQSLQVMTILDGVYRSHATWPGGPSALSLG